MIEPTATTPTTQPLKIMVGADSFKCALKDTLVSHLNSLNIKVKDLGTSTYYSIETLGLFASHVEREKEENEKMDLIKQNLGKGWFDEFIVNALITPIG